MPKMRFFAPITKVNEETREVEGVLALERKDKTGDIMDYASSKEHFVAWSNEIHKASGGKSFGNVREMHGRIAAGKLTAIEFDDVKKEIRAVSKIVDDGSWEKVQEGVLNGFSIGGDSIKRWNDPVLKAKRYTVKPFEVSLADNPCMYGSEFSVVRSNGEVEIRKFTGNNEVTQYWDCGNDCSIKHDTKFDAAHCEDVEKMHFQNEETEEIEAIDNNTEDSISPIADEGEHQMKVKVTKSAGEAEDQFVEIDETELTKSVAKSVATAMGTALKEQMDEITSELREDIQALSGAISKMAGLPKKTKVVTKAMDRKSVEDEEEAEEEEKPKKIQKTANREDLVGIMKTALRRPITVVSDDPEDEEEAEDEK